MYQCRAADHHLMCPTCTGTSLEECDKRQRLQPCQTETERCATIKVFDVRGVLEILMICRRSISNTHRTSNTFIVAHRLGNKSRITKFKFARNTNSIEILSMISATGGEILRPAD